MRITQHRNHFILVFMILAAIVTSSTAAAAGPKQIQVFDIAQGKVIQQIENSPKVREEVEQCLESVSELVARLRVEPKDGIVLRIPMEPSAEIQNQWIKEQVSEVFIIIPRSEKPFMLLFTADKKPIILKFKHPVKKLLKELKIS